MRLAKDQKIIVTGNMGFIGQHVVRCLREEHGIYDILGVDRKKRVESHETRNVRHQICKDITPDLLEDLSGYKATAIIHLAGNPFVGSCQAFPEESWRDNVFSTEVMIKAGLMLNVPRFVLASSAAVVERDTQLVYGRDKMLAEWLCSSADIEELVHLRYFNVYGPGAHSGVIVEWAKAIRDGLRPRLEGDGRTVRDFVHVEDVARATCLAALRPVDEPATYSCDICTGIPTTLAELADLMGVERESFSQAPAAETAQFSLGEPEYANKWFGFVARKLLEDNILSTMESARRIV